MSNSYKYLVSAIAFTAGVLAASGDSSDSGLSRLADDMRNITFTHDRLVVSDPGQERHRSVALADSRFDEAKVASEMETVFEKRLPKSDKIPLEYADFKIAEKSLSPEGMKWKSERLEPTVFSGSRVAGNLKEGVMYTKDVNLSDGLYSSTTLQLSPSTSDPSQFSIKGIWGLSTPVTVVVNAAEGTLTMAAQIIYRNSIYGDLYVCPIKGNSYDPNGTIDGIFDAAGNVTLSSWGVFAISGTYAGYALATFSSTRWLVPNVIVSTSGPRDQDNMHLSGAVEQENVNTVNIYGVLGYDNVIVGTLTPSRTIRISPQKLYTAQVGTVMCYPVEETTVNGQTGMMINYSGNVTGTATEDGFSLAPWTAAVKGYGSAYVLESTNYTLATQLEYPAPLSAEWKGSGTVADPYIISTPAELLLLSQKVEDGNTFEGYNFALGGDLDMSAADRGFTAIGSLNVPFNGVFDGRNHIIRNFSYNAFGAQTAGLFGAIGKEGTVRNLTLQDCRLTGSGPNLGLLAGILQGEAVNVRVNSSTVSGTGEISAGLVGHLEGSVVSCSFSGNVSGPGYVAGLVGFNAGVVDGSYATATVSLTGMYSNSYHNAAGLCTAVASSQLGNGVGVVRDSYFGGEVRDMSGVGHVGGLVCVASRATIERSFNVGVVQARLTSDEEASTYAGGLIAYITSSYVKDCYNAGTVIAQVTGSSSMRAVGGLFGYLSVTRVSSSAGSYFSSLSRVENCYNSAMVITPNENPKQGIYGRTWDGNEDELEETIFSNVYSDNQIFHGDTSKYGRTTRYLMNSSLPAGFSADVWTVSPNQYPVLKSTASSDGAMLSAAGLVLASDQWTEKVKNAAQLSRSGSVSWSLVDASGIPSASSENATIVNGSALTVGGNYSNEVLIASTPDGVMKLYRLGLVPAGLYEGNGTEASPYLLKTPSDWNNLHTAVNNFAQGHEGDFFKMASDVDFKGSSFRGVGAGNTVNTFEGTLDGAGYTVHNLTVAAANVSSTGVLQSAGNYWHGGLFSVIGKSGVVKNIVIASDASVTVYHYGAPVVGQLLGRVENCRNYADVTCYGAYAGGIAGVVRDMGKVIGCYNAGKIYTTRNTGQGAAGIAGYNIGTISYSQNDGDILLDSGGKNSAGGIAAYNSGTVEYCVNNANVSGPAYVGGITGAVTYANGAGYINGCVSNGLAILSQDGLTLGAIAGTTDGIRGAANNYYDSSVNVDGALANAGHPGMKGVSTTTLVSGAVLDGLDNAKFDFSAGKYPVLTQFKDEVKGAEFRQVYINFDDSQVRNNMKKNVSLTAPTGFEWSVEPADNDYFSISGNTLFVTVPSGMELGHASVSARKGMDMVKTFDLKTLPVYLTGEGTDDSPYLINNVEDFTKLATFVNTTGNDYKGVSFRLVNDLDFNGTQLPMIAGAPADRNSIYKFQGKFDGNGKRIHNFKYIYDNHTTAVNSGGDRIGIFGTLGEAGEVRNLTSEGELSGLRYVAGIAGVLYGKVENCVNKTVVNATMSAGSGGIAGAVMAGASIVDCLNLSRVRVESTYGGGGIAGEVEASTVISGCVNEGEIVGGPKAKYLGGIAGRASGVISDCTNKGGITSEAPYSSSPMNFFGGIIGSPYSGNLHIRGCVNEADISLPNQTAVGGILGGTTTARSETSIFRMDSCFNRGSISALGTVGGIAGFVPAGTQIYDCGNYGKVSAVHNPAMTRAVGTATTATRSGYTGGFAGYVGGQDVEFKTTLISRCFNEGTVESGMDYTGGFAAYNSVGAIIDSCYNSGAINAMSIMPALNGALTSYHVGGIVSDQSGILSYCWNSGKITADGHDIGGIVGLQNANARILNCVNIGEVTVLRSAANDAITFQPVGGGVIGRANGSKNYNIINLGDVVCPDRAAGLVSMLFAGNPTTEVVNGYTYSSLTNTNAGATMISNTGNFRDSNLPILSNLYYVKDQNPHIGTNVADASEGVRAVDIMGLRAAEFGEGFVSCKAGLPMVRGLYQAAPVHFKAAGIGFCNEADSEESVSDNINISDLSGLVWTSSDGIEIVGSIALPRKLGRQWLKVTTADGTLEKQFDLNVTKVNTAVMPSTISFDRNEIEAAVDEELTINVSLTPDNVTEAEKTLVWTSTDPDIAMVTDGKVRCLTPGTVVITATTVNNLSAKCYLTVMDILPTNVTLSEHSRSAYVGDVFTLTADIAPANCTSRQLRWTSDNTNICMVDEEGNVTVTGLGEAVITATAVNGLSDSCRIMGMAGVAGTFIDGKEVKSVEYWSLQGQRLSSPLTHGVSLIKYMFSDGSSVTLKIIAGESI